MEQDTLDDLKRLRSAREASKWIYRRDAKAFRDAIVTTDLPVSRLASELGISRQAIYQLREKDSA